MGTRCEHCAGPMPLVHRADAKFCKGSCRVAALRIRQALPAELTSRPRWVRYSPSKVPLQTGARRAASSTDPRTWSDYATVRRSKVGVGYGFVLNGDGIVCLDLDDCLVDGVPADWAMRLLEQLPATYIEISPSGNGLHVWGRGAVGRGRRLRFGKAKVEVYGTGRYITVTGRRYGDCQPALADLTETLNQLLDGVLMRA